MTGTKIYVDWKSMKGRCCDKNKLGYKDYGGRGITICEQWMNSFLSYYEFVSKLPNYGVKGYTLDRIENNGNYEPNNVKYSTKSEQAFNRRISTTGTSKFRGVSWHKNAKKWVTHITIGGKKQHVGLFTSELEASNAYKEALKEHVSPKLIK